MEPQVKSNRETEKFTKPKGTEGHQGAVGENADDDQCCAPPAVELGSGSPDGFDGGVAVVSATLSATTEI